MASGVFDREIPGGAPSYQVVTSELTSLLTVGVRDLLTLWHPATAATDVLITEIGVNARVLQTVGSFSFELQFISAENVTPGGVAVVPQPLFRGAPASAVIGRSGPNAPTVVGQVFQRASFPVPAAASPWIGERAFEVFSCRDPRSDAIILRAGQAEGIRIAQNVAAALTGAPVLNIYVKFIEF